MVAKSAVISLLSLGGFGPCFAVNFRLFLSLDKRPFYNLGLRAKGKKPIACCKGWRRSDQVVGTGSLAAGRQGAGRERAEPGEPAAWCGMCGRGQRDFEACF